MSEQLQSITQETVDTSIAALREELALRVQESGLSQAVYIALDKDKWFASRAYEYTMAKETVEEQGLVMPEFIPGLVVNVSDEDTDGPRAGM